MSTDHLTKNLNDRFCADSRQIIGRHMFKEPTTPSIKQQLVMYKGLYLKYFNKCHFLTSEIQSVKMKAVEHRAEIADLKLEREKLSLPFLGKIS